MNKMIHANEFRLRILLTNKCNKNCSFCLNDFQKKGEDFAMAFDVVDCIRAYGQFMKSIHRPSIVTFSGGEPGIYPMLDIVLSHARQYCDCVKVATNGTALAYSMAKYVDKWHVHPTDRDLRIVDYHKETGRVAVQIVVTDEMNDSYLADMVHYYWVAGVPVKLFADFYSKNRENVFDRIKDMQVKFPGVDTRFTGKQVNRGAACAGCDRDCVTLKALWYFPDGTSSTCPQGVKPLYDDDSWDETVEKAYRAHRLDQTMNALQYVKSVFSTGKELPKI